MFTDTSPDIDVSQSLTGARDSTVIGLAETVNVAYNLLPEEARARPQTRQTFHQIEQLIFQLNQQLQETENKQLTRLVNMNVERYIQLGTWWLYALGLVAAVHSFLAGLVMLLILAGLAGAVWFSARYALEYRRVAEATRATQAQIDAYLQQVDPRLTLAVTRPYRSASRFPVLSGHRRWQLVQVVLLTLGGFALSIAMLPGPGFEEVWLTSFITRLVVFLAVYTLVVVLASTLRLNAERIKLQLFTEDHLFHLRFGPSAEGYVQIVDVANLAEEAVTPDALLRPIFGREGTAEQAEEVPIQPPHSTR